LVFYWSVHHQILKISPLSHQQLKERHEESSLLEVVARGRLMKTQQAGKGLAGAAVICEL
jgi:hypothetical protein